MSNHALANDVNGCPFDVPAEAVRWRVRRMTRKQGRSIPIFEPATGRPLEIPIDATADALRAAGCRAGKYRLDPIDARGRAVGTMHAFTEIGGSPDEAQQAESLAAETIKTLREANSQLADTARRTADANAQLTDTARKTMEAIQEFARSFVAVVGQVQEDKASKHVETPPVLDEERAARVVATDEKNGVPK